MKKIIGTIGILVSLYSLYLSAKIFMYQVAYVGYVTEIPAIAIGFCLLIASIITTVSNRRLNVTLIALGIYVLGAFVSFTDTYNNLIYFFRYFLLFSVLLIIELVKNKKLYKSQKLDKETSLNDMK